MPTHFSDEGIRSAYSIEIQSLLASAEVFRRSLPSHINSGSAHSGEEGRWTESLLTEFLKRKLPSDLEVSTGFIVNPEIRAGSYQTDILVHDPSRYAPILRYGEAVILHPKSVVAAISVKYKLRTEHLKKELGELRHIGDICNQFDTMGPYLAVIGFYLDDSLALTLSDQGTKWKKNANAMSKAIVRIFEGFQKRKHKVSTNEIVDTVATLDGYLMHASKGAPPTRQKSKEQPRENVKLLSGGAGAGNFAIGAEIVQGIVKRYEDHAETRVWPSRSGMDMTQIGRVKTVVYGRPPSKASTDR